MLPILARVAFCPTRRTAPTFTIAALTIGWLVAAPGESRLFAADPQQSAAARQQWTMAEPPPKAADVLDVRRSLNAKKQPDGSANLAEVTVTGQIGGMPNPWTETHPDFPWYRGQASFFLLDSKVASQFARHAKSHGGHANCSFCQQLAAKNAHAVAVVNFVDAQGKVLKTDARELLALRENQKVVIRGKAQLLGGSFVVITAEAIHARR